MRLRHSRNVTLGGAKRRSLRTLESLFFSITLFALFVILQLLTAFLFTRSFA